MQQQHDAIYRGSGGSSGPPSASPQVSVADRERERWCEQLSAALRGHRPATVVQMIGGATFAEYKKRSNIAADRCWMAEDLFLRAWNEVDAELTKRANASSRARPGAPRTTGASSAAEVARSRARVRAEFLKEEEDKRKTAIARMLADKAARDRGEDTSAKIPPPPGIVPAHIFTLAKLKVGGAQSKPETYGNLAPPGQTTLSFKNGATESDAVASFVTLQNGIRVFERTLVYRYGQLDRVEDREYMKVDPTSLREHSEFSFHDGRVGTRTDFSDKSVLGRVTLVPTALPRFKAKN